MTERIRNILIATLALCRIIRSVEDERDIEELQENAASVEVDVAHALAELETKGEL